MPQKAETARTWGWEVAGAPALRLQRSQSSELLEREMESVLRREQEVAEERRHALFPEVFSPQPDGDPDSRSSSRASGEEGSGRGAATWIWSRGGWSREGWRGGVWGYQEGRRVEGPQGDSVRAPSWLVSLPVCFRKP